MRRRNTHAGDQRWAEVARGAGVTQKTARKVVDLFLAQVRDEAWQRGRLVVPGLLIATVRRTKARKISPPPGAELRGTVRIASGEVVKLRATKNWRTK